MLLCVVCALFAVCVVIASLLFVGCCSMFCDALRAVRCVLLAACCLLLADGCAFLVALVVLCWLL